MTEQAQEHEEENQFAFSNIRFGETDPYPVQKWPHKKVINDIRVYYRVNDMGIGHGLKFYVTDFKSCPIVDNITDEYEVPGMEVECLFRGWIYYDGLRHLYMGDQKTDNYNYLYSMNTLRLAKVFEKLRELELKHCNKDLLE